MESVRRTVLTLCDLCVEKSTSIFRCLASLALASNILLAGATPVLAIDWNAPGGAPPSKKPLQGVGAPGGTPARNSNPREGGGPQKPSVSGGSGATGRPVPIVQKPQQGGAGLRSVSLTNITETATRTPIPFKPFKLLEVFDPGTGKIQFAGKSRGGLSPSRPDQNKIAWAQVAKQDALRQKGIVITKTTQGKGPLAPAPGTFSGSSRVAVPKRDGTSVELTADQYLAELNDLERKLNALGYSLRDPATGRLSSNRERTKIGKLKVNDDLLAKQQQKVRAAAKGKYVSWEDSQIRKTYQKMPDKSTNPKSGGPQKAAGQQFGAATKNGSPSSIKAPSFAPSEIAPAGGSPSPEKTAYSYSAPGGEGQEGSGSFKTAIQLHPPVHMPIPDPRKFDECIMNAIRGMNGGNSTCRVTSMAPGPGTFFGALDEIVLLGENLSDCRVKIMRSSGTEEPTTQIIDDQHLKVQLPNWGSWEGPADLSIGPRTADYTCGIAKLDFLPVCKIEGDLTRQSGGAGSVVTVSGNRLDKSCKVLFKDQAGNVADAKILEAGERSLKFEVPANMAPGAGNFNFFYQGSNRFTGGRYFMLREGPVDYFTRGIVPFEKQYKWEQDFGDPSIFAGGLSTGVYIGSNGPVEDNRVNLSGNGRADGHLFTMPFEILDIQANASIPSGTSKDDKLRASFAVTVVGETIYSPTPLSEDVQIAYHEDWGKRVDPPPVETSFMIGPIPMTARFGFRGAGGVKLDFGLSPIQIVGSVRPYLETSVYGEAAIDVFIATGGLGVGLTLINAGLDASASASVDFNELAFVTEMHVCGDLNILSGRVYAFVEVYNPFGDNPEWEFEICNWSGFVWRDCWLPERREAYPFWVAAK